MMMRCSGGGTASAPCRERFRMRSRRAVPDDGVAGLGVSGLEYSGWAWST